MSDSVTDTSIIALTADIVSAHLSHNQVPTDDLPNLIRSVFDALARTAEPLAVEVTRAEPAVSVRASIKPDYLVCLEDGAKLKMLKRYLRTNFDMTPEQYRAKWNLPADYPMVAPNYAAVRRDLAHKIGLGRKAKETVAPAALAASRKRLGIAHPKAAAEPVAADTETTNN